MKKQWIAMACAAAMLGSMVTGCSSTAGKGEKAEEGKTEESKMEEGKTEGSQVGTASSPSHGEEAAEQITLKLALFKGGYGDQFWTAVTQAYSQAHPNVSFEIDCDPSIGDKVNSSMLAGDVPDFIYCPSNNVSGLAQRLIKDQALTDLTDLFEDGLKDRILDGFLETSLSQPYGDGKIYLAPLYYTANGLFYNATLFEETGLETPSTWDEFFAMGDSIKGQDICGRTDRSLFTYQGGNDPGYMGSVIIPLLASELGADGLGSAFRYDAAQWEKPGVKTVFEVVERLGDGYLLPNTTGIDHTTAQTAVMNGSALFVPCGSWIVEEMKDIEGEEINGKPFEWGFAPTPALNPDNKYLQSTVEEVYIPADAEHVEEAKEFLAYLYSDEAIRLNAETTKGIPPVKGAAELTKDLLSPMIYSTFQSFDNGYKPFIGNFVAVDSEIVPKKEFFGHVNAVVDRKETVDEWIAATIELCNKVKDHVVTAQ